MSFYPIVDLDHDLDHLHCQYSVGFWESKDDHALHFLYSCNPNHYNEKWKRLNRNNYRMQLMMVFNLYPSPAMAPKCRAPNMQIDITNIQSIQDLLSTQESLLFQRINAQYMLKHKITVIEHSYPLTTMFILRICAILFIF